MVSPSRRLGEFLVDRKVLSRDDLEAMLAREAKEGVPLPRLLVAEQLVSEKDLVAAVADQVGIPFVDFATTPVHPEADRLVPADLARAHQAVAVAIEGTNLVVAMADPADEAALAALREATGWDVRPAIADRAELARVIAGVYGRAKPAKSAADEPIEIRLEEPRPP